MFFPRGTRIKLLPDEHNEVPEHGVVIATAVDHNGAYMVELDPIYWDESDPDDDGLREVMANQMALSTSVLKQ